MKYDEKATAILRMEERSLNAWPALMTEVYQGALLRFAGGYTKRSNSVNPLYFHGHIKALIERAENVYSQNSMPSVFKILETEAYRSVDKTLEEQGYTKIDKTHVKTITLTNNPLQLSTRTKVDTGFSSEWLDAYIAANSLEPKRRLLERILENIQADTLVASVLEKGNSVAFGYGALEDGWVGFYNIYVRSDYRGYGYGHLIMETLMRAAAERGISHGYLQVMENNLPAIALYENLGFQPFYNYWYRRKNG